MKCSPVQSVFFLVQICIKNDTLFVIREKYVFWHKCVYIAPLCTQKKLKIFFACGRLCEKFVYMTIWHPKNNQYFFRSVESFGQNFFHLAKKSYFSRMSNCLSNFDWSFVLLYNPLSSAAFLEDNGQKC